MATVQEVIGEVRGARIATVSMRTPVRMRKTGNPYADDVFTVARKKVQFNFFLSNAVRKALAEKGIDPESYVAGKTWHEQVYRQDGTLTPFRRHLKTGELYLWIRPMKNYEKHFERGNGTPIAEEEFAQFVQKSETPYARQGLGEDYIPAITVRLENVKEVVFDGEHEIEDDTEGNTRLA